MIKASDKKVIDLTIPIDEFGKIHQDCTLLEVLTSLELMRDRETSPENRLALLVVNDNDEVIGKVGILACLKALVPHFCVEFDDIEKIRKIDEFHSDFLKTILCKKLSEHYKSDYKIIGRLETRVIDIMYPIGERIDGESSIITAINRITAKNALSMLVTSDKEVTGLVYLFDLFNELSRAIQVPDN